MKNLGSHHRTPNGLGKFSRSIKQQQTSFRRAQHQQIDVKVVKAEIENQIPNKNAIVYFFFKLVLFAFFKDFSLLFIFFIIIEFSYLQNLQQHKTKKSSH